MTRRELRRIIRTGDDATAWQAAEWLDRMPRRTVREVFAAARRRVPAGLPLVLAAALVGALLGAWISPGRAYAGPDTTTVAAVKVWKPCKYEDGSGQRRCVWDARHMGNGEGHSLIIRKGGTDAVKYVRITHRKAHRLIYGGKWT